MVRKVLLAGILLVSLAVFASCGGGGTTTTPGDNTGNQNPPGGVVGNIDAAPIASDFPVLQEIQGASTDAPLGTNPAYNVRPASGELITGAASKAGSELLPSQLLKINWITAALQGEDPNPEAELSFKEGDKISFWAEYEVANDVDFARYWTLDTAGLEFVDYNVNHGQAGVYKVRFDLTLPYGSASEEARFTLELGPPKESSVAVTQDVSDSAMVTMAIAVVPVEPPIDYPVLGHAQMCWEDLIVNSDYDYNDLVASMHAKEFRNLDNELVQIELEVKALARGAGYTSDWQFNMEAAFPGADVTAIVDQYYDDGDGDHSNDLRHGPQRIWHSNDGTSVPVFAPTKAALPKPPDHSFATNVVANTTYMEGDYAIVVITLNPPLAQGTYTPIPYEPELRVHPSSGGVYEIGLWREPGDPVDSNGRPLGFIIPDTFAWPLECKRIWNCYPTFGEWVNWVNNPNLPEQDPLWYDTSPVRDCFDRSLFK